MSHSVTLPSTPKKTILDDTSLSNIKILVVDDTPDIRFLLAQVLKKQGAVVTTAESGIDGFNKVKSFKPQVILSDISMPEEDGYSFLRRVRALEHPILRNIPAIALTGYANDFEKQEMYNAGFQMHIAKPVDIQGLTSAIFEVFEKGANLKILH